MIFSWILSMKDKKFDCLWQGLSEYEYELQNYKVQSMCLYHLGSFVGT